MNRTPRVSIGVPVYNGAKYLAECLRSLTYQTFDDFEVIVSDNCSSDSTKAIARDFASRDSRIRYVQQSNNIGAIGNFNAVFEYSRGEYFKWAAYDDLCKPSFLQQCVELLDSRSDVVWCHCDSDRIDSLGATLPVESGFPLRRNHDSEHAAERWAGVVLGTNWCVDSYGLVRAEALRRTRMLQPFYGAEKVLMGELALQGKYGHIHETLFAQRIHEAASSNLNTAHGQAAFAVGGGRRFLPTRFAVFAAHLGAIRHAKLSWTNSLACYGVAAKYVFQIQKWRSVLNALIRRRGVGGDGIDRLRTAHQPARKPI